MRFLDQNQSEFSFFRSWKVIWSKKSKKKLPKLLEFANGIYSNLKKKIVLEMIGNWMLISRICMLTRQTAVDIGNHQRFAGVQLSGLRGLRGLVWKYLNILRIFGSIYPPECFR